MWSNLVLASCVLFLSTIGQLDISGDKKLLDSSIPNSLQLLKQEFQSQIQANYATSDKFYFRWLRAHNFNIARTRESLSKHVIWRDDYISKRERRDSWAEKHIPIQTLQDKQGEPVLYYDMAKYDLRKLSEENQLDAFPLTIMRKLETTCENIFDAQQAGQNVSLLGVLVDWTRFSASKQLCPHCIPAFLNIAKYYENNYPLTCSRVINVNTPKLFIPVGNLMKTLLDEELRNSFLMFSNDEVNSAKLYLDS